MITASRRDLANQALSIALKTRKAIGAEIWQPLCIFDAAEKLGVEVRFENIPSMEGMYCKDPGPLILITSERPVGRQRFSCAHELGHHVFDHGTLVDELIGNSQKPFFDPKEFLADCFASYFLMPKVAVKHAFDKRTWNPSAASPGQVFAVANYLGVGYASLIHHMQIGLGLISESYAKGLLKIQPKQLRSAILGADSPHEIIQVDKHWVGRPVDIQVGDFVIIPPHLNLEGNSAQLIKRINGNNLFQGTTAGLTRFYSEEDGWGVFVRVCRKNYVGRNCYRHLTEVEEENE